MRPIKDLVPLDRRDHPAYLLEYKQLEQDLSATTSIGIYCAHEAGHLIFFRRAGFTEFEFAGPTIHYDERYQEENNRYSSFPAAVMPIDLKLNSLCNYSDELLDSLARAGAAGDIFNEFEQGKTPRPPESSDDFYHFDQHCRRALQQDSEIRYDAKGRWKRAQGDVRAYLRDNSNAPTIESAISEVRRQCFDL